MNKAMNLINLWITFSVWGYISLYPMWRKRNREKSKTVMIIGMLLVLAESCVVIFYPLDYYTLQLFKVSGFFIYLFLSYYLYKGLSFQCLFLLAVSCMYQTAILGLGIFVEEILGGPFSAKYPMLINNGVCIAISLLLMPILLRMLRRIFTIVGMEQSSFWRMVWIIPMLFFVLCAFSGDIIVYRETSDALSFVAVRLLMTAAMLFICYFLSSVLKTEVRSAEAEENARMMELQLSLQREQYDLIAAGIEQTRAARHDLRQHMSVVRSFLAVKDYDATSAYLDEYQIGRASCRERV